MRDDEARSSASSEALGISTFGGGAENLIMVIFCGARFKVHSRDQLRAKMSDQKQPGPEGIGPSPCITGCPRAATVDSDSSESRMNKFLSLVRHAIAQVSPTVEKTLGWKLRVNRILHTRLLIAMLGKCWYAYGLYGSFGL
jgi:hypothetical protein